MIELEAKQTGKGEVSLSWDTDIELVTNWTIDEFFHNQWRQVATTPGYVKQHTLTGLLSGPRKFRVTFRDNISNEVSLTVVAKLPTPDRPKPEPTKPQ